HGGERVPLKMLALQRSSVRVHKDMHNNLVGPFTPEPKRCKVPFIFNDTECMC
ncbi:hypothetical protein A2U01_0023579, partial [Trifolium medium]|nr:hypothetical protein [Trifolium medium]